MWKCRAVENEENQNQVSLVFHRPWKSLRDSHIPTTPTTILPFPDQNQKTRKEPQLRRKPQPPSSGSSFDEKMLVAHAFVRAVPAFVPVCFQESARGGRAGRTRYRAGRGFCGLPEDLCAGKTCRARKPDTARLEPCATSRAAKAVTRPLGMGIVGNSGEKIGQDRDVRTCLLPVGAAWRNVIAERPPRAVVLKP